MALQQRLSNMIGAHLEQEGAFAAIVLEFRMVKHRLVLDDDESLRNIMRLLNNAARAKLNPVNVKEKMPSFAKDAMSKERDGL
jgi:hypothetical protein